MEPKTIRQGGDNSRQIHLSGPVSYGQVTLKRGMTSGFHLWQWFDKVQQEDGRGLRADAEILMLSSDPERRTNASFRLERCVPLRLRAPALNAKEGLLAVEELQLAYERLSFESGGS